MIKLGDKLGAVLNKIKITESTAVFEVRDLRGGNFYTIHNIVVDVYVPKAKKKGCYVLAVYNCLCRYTNKDTQKSYPSIRKLTELLGCSHVTVLWCLNFLESEQLIRIEHNKVKGKPNIYYLLKINT